MFLFKSHPLAILGIVVLIFWIVAAIVGPRFTGFTYSQLDIDHQMVRPGEGGHLLGTDALGRDILARILTGSRSILTVALLTSLISTLAGVIIGFTAGYFGGKVDALFLRIMDILMSFPDIMLALALMAIFGRGLFNVIIAIGIVFTPRIARLMFGLTLEIRETTYVESARALGVSHWRILTRYIIINALSSIIVQASFTFAFCIIAVASLDFLGVGIPPYIPSWGGIVSEGRTYLTRAPWIMTFPGIAIVLTTLSLNLVGDALRDALDPRLRRLL